VQTSVERVDDTTVKLSITVEPTVVSAAYDAAARKLAGQVKIPGFRPGRVPRRVLETRLGTDVIREEAVRDALPGLYAEALRSESLDVVSPPEFDVDQFVDGDEATFTATVQVRPTFDVPDYSDLQIAHPDWEVTDEEVTAQLDAMRERFAELETVQRGADVGDYVTVTIRGERAGQKVDEASGEDLLYPIGDPEETGSELDRQLLGAEAGAILKFTDTLDKDYGEDLRGAQVDFTAIVKEVKRKRLPDLDDDFAITASEFDTASELVAELRAQLAEAKRQHARAELRGKVVEAVSDLAEVPLPEAMVAEEVRFRLQRISQQAEHHGMGIDQYLQAAGQPSEQLLSELEAGAGKTVKAQLVIDAVGRDAGIEVERQDIANEISRQAQHLDRPAEELAEFMSHPDRAGALISDAFRRKVIDHLVASVQVLSGPPDDEDEQDAPVDEIDGHDGPATP
jgi:trigger factor